jgi:hypothetical protein
MTHKDQELPLRVPTMPPTAAQGEAAASGQDAATMQFEDMALDFGTNLQWQLPAGVGPDMLGAGLPFSWDQCLDLISGDFGVDISH